MPACIRAARRRSISSDAPSRCADAVARGVPGQQHRLVQRFAARQEPVLRQHPEIAADQARQAAHARRSRTAPCLAGGAGSGGRRVPSSSRGPDGRRRWPGGGCAPASPRRGRLLPAPLQRSRLLLEFVEESHAPQRSVQPPARRARRSAAGTSVTLLCRAAGRRRGHWRARRSWSSHGCPVLRPAARSASSGWPARCPRPRSK